MLLPTLADPNDRAALRFGADVLTHAELAGAACAVADTIAGARRVAVQADPALTTCVAVVGALLAGAAVIPINPRIGERELAHIITDSEPDLILLGDTPAASPLPRELDRIHVDLTRRGMGPLPSEPDGESTAFIVYTSGTTGPPKGVMLPRRALTSNLDALAAAWAWTSADTVVHALPLFHVHGLILGVLGPLRRGGTTHHIGRFSTSATAEALAAESTTMMFGVPTMYSRLAADCEADGRLAAGISRARLLVSGSAALPASVHQRVLATTGHAVIERYGMTETLMNCGVRVGGEIRPGTVGPPIDGVELRLVDDDGQPVISGIGEIEVSGPNLFTGYLNRPDATARCLRGGWFRTGDMAVMESRGYLRIVGRRATDLIKSGGYKIGAGEIENALLEHPAVAEVAVTGEPDDDLGERIVAWVVPAGERPAPEELADHVARLLAPHKRPRVVRFLTGLPRNEMGKVMKRALTSS